MPELSVYQWVIFTAFTAHLIPMCLGMVQYKKLPPELKVLFWWSVSSFVLDGISSLLWINSVSNLFLGHIHTVVEVTFLVNVYRIWFKGQFFNRLMMVVVLGFAVLAILNTAFLQAFETNSTYTKLLESIVFISLALYYFYQLARKMTVSRPEKEPMFWLSTAALIYFSGSFFIFAYANFIMVYSVEFAVRIWFLHAVFFILFNLLIGIAFWTVLKNYRLPGYS